MKKNKNVAIFVGIILVISVITGFIYGLRSEERRVGKEC